MDLKKLLVVFCALVGLACGAGSSAAREEPAASRAPVVQPAPVQRPVQDAVELGETVDLKAGETTEVASKDVSIRFARLVSDSRCAEGMVCVWEGEAVIELALAEPGRGERTTAALASTGRGGRQSVEFAACRVDLVAVSSGGDQVTLRVSKA
ncbi:hypothetical protein ACFORH_19900 [Amycolatopsis roodepoortensis]|uniref:Uncharacterized protein n=1 Tax=Amycolatopsis roodepoortensis TaxID=700274 RepID=A0ABR9LDG4_9PSEU|nr:hypothetical protein [Amycolatopsis roodepoortensis]MBE1578733.1 hypothetical protein [Amycolatopsis roodepoortensis]